MPESSYPTVEVPLHQIEQLRRTLSHFAELHAQADIILSDLRDLVGRLPDAEDSAQVPYREPDPSEFGPLPPLDEGGEQ